MPFHLVLISETVLKWQLEIILSSPLITLSPNCGSLLTKVPQEMVKEKKRARKYDDSPENTRTR